MNNFVRSISDIIRVGCNFRFPSLEDQRELVSRKLAIEKQEGELSIFKYHRNVMYDYTWNKSRHLMECRGHVYNNKTGELVVAPPRKSFNYLENDWWKDVPLNTQVYYAKKYNGFLGCVSVNDGKLMYSTTGSMNSQFVDYIRETTKPVDFVKEEWQNETLHVEVMHKDDPHIVEEFVSFAALATRNKVTGNQVPYGLRVSTLGDVLDLATVSLGEGFMVYVMEDTNFLSPCKIKTPYYIGKKKLMRATKNAVDKMYADPVAYANTLPDAWISAPSYIVSEFSKESWLNMDAQQRRIVIEGEQHEYFNMEY